jgi:hypothetical protein
MATLRLYVEDDSGQTLPGSGNRAVSLSGRGAGQYFVKIVGDSQSTVSSYSLTINAPGSTVAAADWARGNDAPGKEKDLGVIASEALFSGLGVAPGGAEWFSFETPRNPSQTPGHLQIIPSAGGSLSADLYDQSGNLLKSLNSAQALTFSFMSGSGASYRLAVHGQADYSIRFLSSAQPLVRVLDGNSLLTAGSGQIDFGRTSIGAPADRIIVVRNDGSADLVLSSNVSLPAGFSVVAGPAATVLGPGAGTSFTLRLGAATAGVWTGTATLATNDPAAASFSFQLTGVVQAPTPPPDITPPSVVTIKTTSKAGSLASIAVTFSEPMDARSLGSLSDFRLTSAGKDKIFGTRDDKALRLTSVAIDPGLRKVTLKPKGKVALNQPLELRIEGLTDKAGNPLDGDRNGTPGGAYASRFGAKPKSAPKTKPKTNASASAILQVNHTPEASVSARTRIRAHAFDRLALGNRLPRRLLI